MGYRIPRAFSTIAVVAGLLAPAAFAGVDPALLALVMPDTKILSGVQVSQAQSTPLGQYLFSQLQFDPNTNRVLAAAGFDPRRDLKEILAASGDGSSGLVLGRGSFQPAKIGKAAVLAGAVSTTYRGVELLSFADLPGVPGRGVAAKSKSAASVAFLDASTVAAGDTEAVKAVIDRRGSGTVLSGQLAEKAREISVANDVWIATLTQPAGLSGAMQSPQLGPMQTLLQSAVQLSAGLKFSAEEVTLSAEVTARTAQDAQSMAGMMKFLAGMLQSSRSQDPKANPNGPKLPSFADTARISSSGSVMYLIVSLPEHELEQLFVPTSRPPSSDKPKKVAMGNYGTVQPPTGVQPELAKVSRASR